MVAKLVVILDFDGVVFDSVEKLKDGFFQFGRRFGMSLTEGDFQNYNGWRLDAILRDLQVKFQLPLDPANLLKEYYEFVDAAYAKSELTPGLKEFLEHARKSNIPLCVASSSQRGLIQKQLRRFEIESYFHEVVAGDDVKKGKPHPETYEIIKAKVPSEEYWVIEDSLAVQSGPEAAGMHFVFFGKLLGTSVAPVRVRDFRELSRRLTAKILTDCSFADVERFEVRMLNPSLVHDEEETSRWWKQKLAESDPQRVLLYDGECLSVVSAWTEKQELRIHAEAVRYRHYLFSRDKKSSVPFISMAVSGLVTNAREEILVGLRSSQVSNYPDCLELAPSGNLTSQQSPQEEVLNELQEEAGIAKKHVKQMTFLGVVYESPLLNLCFSIRVSEGDFDIPENREYTWLKFLPHREVTELFKNQKTVPTSKTILERWVDLKSPHSKER